MKKTAIKIIISLILLSVVFIVAKLISNNYTANEDGSIHLIIVDELGETVFDEAVEYYKDDTFFDLLNRKFVLTCANQMYQSDETCSYEFVIMGQKNRVLLGIKNESFEIITDFNQTFIQIETYIDDAFVISSLGVSQLEFNDGTIIRLSVKRVGF